MSKVQLLDKLAESKQRMKELQEQLNDDSTEQASLLGICTKKVHLDE